MEKRTMKKTKNMVPMVLERNNKHQDTIQQVGWSKPFVHLFRKYLLKKTEGHLVRTGYWILHMLELCWCVLSIKARPKRPEKKRATLEIKWSNKESTASSKKTLEDHVNVWRWVNHSNRTSATKEYHIKNQKNISAALSMCLSIISIPSRCTLCDNWSINI